jgi:hypothetical protein
MPLTQVQSGMMDSIAQYNSFKNRIINGQMAISQRGTSGFTTANTTIYTTDRWAVFSGSGLNATYQQTSSIGLTGFQYSLRAQRNSGNTAVTNLLVFQIIENANMQDLIGQTVTLSAYIRVGANYSGGTINLGISTGTGTNESSSSWVSGTWAGIAYQPTSVTPTTSWQRFSFTATIPSNANELAVYFQEVPIGTAGANDWYEVTGVQLEKGATATAFDYRPYGTELSLCQRYCYVVGGPTSAPVVTSTMYSSTVIYATVPFPVIPRTSPTGILVTGTYTAFASSNAYNITSISIGAGGTVSCEITGTVAGAVAGQSSFIRVNAAGQIQFTGMEL